MSDYSIFTKDIFFVIVLSQIYFHKNNYITTSHYYSTLSFRLLTLQLYPSEMNENEHNFHKLYYDEENYRCRSEAYEIQVDDTYLSEENPYIKSLLESANLKIMQPKMVKKEYEERKELGLFNLFFSPDLTQGIFSWTKKIGSQRTILSYNGFVTYLSWNRNCYEFDAM